MYNVSSKVSPDQHKSPTNAARMPEQYSTLRRVAAPASRRNHTLTHSIRMCSSRIHSPGTARMLDQRNRSLCIISTHFQ